LHAARLRGAEDEINENIGDQLEFDAAALLAFID
jgi:hypothetical protein